MARKSNPKAAAKTDKDTVRPSAAATLKVNAKPGEHHLKTLARISLDPGVRHAQVAMGLASRAFGDEHKLSIMDSTEVLAEVFEKTEQGDLSLASRLHTAQAITLDTLFTELARRAANNMGEHLHAADLYMRLALKAQAACRSSLAELARLHQPREQTVKHVHVNGGQAVVADQFHQHTGGRENDESEEQSHAAGATGESSALPSPDALGNGVPIASGEREAALSDAWRK
jgi:hypothetical protein